MADSELSSQEGSDAFIEGELARVLASPEFTRAPMLSRLLKFLVEYRLRGGGRPPKGYIIATEALGRRADFYVSGDSYPRVMVARLRILLDRHYDQIPWQHRLCVPQGSYEIVVRKRAAPQASRPNREPGTTWASMTRLVMRRRLAGQFIAASRTASVLSQLPKMLARLLIIAVTVSLACHLICG